MSKRGDSDNNLSSTSKAGKVEREDLLGRTSDVISHEIPSGVDRRNVSNAERRGGSHLGDNRTLHQRTGANGQVDKRPAPAVPLSPDLDVVKKQKGPVMTTVDVIL